MDKTEAFDRKISLFVSKTHNKQIKKKIGKIYNDWKEENLNHLINMYRISGLECGLDIFSVYVFRNS